MMTAVSKPTPVPMAPAASDSAPLREQIATFLRTFQNADGAALEELNTRFGTAGPQAVKAAIDELLDEGEAYTTIDENHFAVV